MKIALRLDCATLIGSGHLRRVLALAEALRARGAETALVVRRLPGSPAMLRAAGGFAVHLLEAPAAGWAPPPGAPAHAGWAGVDPERDAIDTADALGAFAPDWVVVDHYAFGAEWHDRVRARLGCRIAVIDDLADRPLAPDLLIDHNYHPDHRAKYAGVLDAASPLLGGPRFALLGPRYADAPRYRFAEPVRSIGLFLGGADAPNHSPRALEAIEAAGFAGPVEIVTTGANPNLAGLRARAAARPDTLLSVDLPDLAAFFARHDLQIGAGGGALWERACIGAPTLCLICAENQRHSVPELEALGALVSHDLLAPGGDLPGLAARIATLLADPHRRRALREAGMRLVDGRGADRVAARLLGE